MISEKIVERRKKPTDMCHFSVSAPILMLTNFFLSQLESNRELQEFFVTFRP